MVFDRPPTEFDLPPSLKIEHKPLRLIFTRKAITSWWDYTRKRFLYTNFSEPMIFFPLAIMCATVALGALLYDPSGERKVLAFPAVVQLYRDHGLERELRRIERLPR